jgi:hypothetical protein
VGVDADRQLVGVVAGCCAAWRNRSTNGAKRSGMPPMMASAIGSSASRRGSPMRIAADRDPDRNLVRRARIDALVVQRRTVRAVPGDAWVSRILISRSSFSANSES